MRLNEDGLVVLTSIGEMIIERTENVCLSVYIEKLKNLYKQKCRTILGRSLFLKYISVCIISITTQCRYVVVCLKSALVIKNFANLQSKTTC
jgi:hypothetical protein